MNNSKTVIIIVGPTASGKTELSLQLAAHFKTSIISADSRQCFKELNIGVAKPSQQALNSIKHYFINSHSINDVVNAQVFEEYALKAAEEIFVENDVAIMVGGTGLYIKAFCEGLDDIPEIDLSVRNDIIKNYKENGITWLQKEVKRKDPEYWLAEQKNPQRLMRALEVFNSTGKSINYFRHGKTQIRPFKIVKIGIEVSKEQLHKNIETRVDEMIAAGLVNEVAALIECEHFNALQTVGYKEIFEYLNKKASLEIAVKNINIHTKQYAKRQLTWFKKDAQTSWNKSWNVHTFLKV